jgi:hypothetical protein
MGFNDITLAGQVFSETNFGESFTYENVSLSGVFDWVQRAYEFEEVGTRVLTVLVCVSSKTQWATANIAPANRGTVTYGGIGYQIESIDGANSAGDPTYTLTLKKLT